jgi:uncharacterized protein (TIGR03437 family)
MRRYFLFFILLATSASLDAQRGEIFLIRAKTHTIQPPSITPGAIFILGFDLGFGPVTARSSSGFPLQTSLDGVSVRVSRGRMAVDAFMISTNSIPYPHVRAILPSNTPTGYGELTLTMNGRTSAPVGVHVVQRQFEIYAHFAGEEWWPQPRALATMIEADGTWSTNGLTRAARPGQTLVLWGAGLGAVAGDEQGGPLPGDLGISDLEVVVGDKRAKVLYAGRSGCCAGMDQIAIEVPSDIEGCFVPVWVRFRDTEEADEGTVALSASGVCSDLPPDVVEKLDGSGSLNLGFISFTSGHAVFGRGPYIVQPAGTCRLQGMPPGVIDFAYGEYARGEAGRVLNVQAPRDLEHWNSIGGWGAVGLPGGEFQADPIRPLTAGSYLVDNGSGGIHVPPFRAKFEVRTPSFNWTNLDNVTSVRRREDIRVTWEGGEVEREYVTISGGSFECRENAAKGSFTVPAYVWGAAIDQSAKSFELTVGLVSHWSSLRFEAPGLDFAYGSYHVAFSKRISIE